MPTNQTLSDAISDMRARGFVNTFTIQHDQIFCSELSTPLAPEQLTLLERHRIQLPAAEKGQREVYGFRTYENQLGIMTDTYAEYAPEEFDAILSRCRQQQADRA
jgi:hypothetical protein